MQHNDSRPSYLLVGLLEESELRELLDEVYLDALLLDEVYLDAL